MTFKLGDHVAARPGYPQWAQGTVYGICAVTNMVGVYLGEGAVEWVPQAWLQKL